jgi:hypothetical protein
MSRFPHLTEATLESIKADADAESFYPADWPHCPACGDYALEWCDQQHNNRHARASGANPARTPARTAHCRRMRQLQLQRARS